MDLDDYFGRRTADARLFELAASYLRPRGWFHSLDGEPQDQSGNSLPWFTYPATAMLTRLLRPDLNVFEFGSGGSTIWWGRHVSEVVSVDHSLDWVEKIRPRLTANTKLSHVPMHAAVDPAHEAVLNKFFISNFKLPVSPSLSENINHGMLSHEFSGYASQILNYPRGHFDIVVVDGMARVLTAWLAAQQVTDNGLIVFDNSNRWQYNAAFAFLIEAGFARIDFWGAGPVTCYEWCTSFFVKNLEILQRNPLMRQDQSELGW